MRQQVRHKQVCEVGQMGQMRTESITGRGVQKSSRKNVSYVSYVPQGALRADSNRSCETHGCGESSRIYLSYVSRGHMGHIVSGVLHEKNVQKVTLVSVPCVPPLFIKFGMRISTSHGGSS